MGGSTSAEVMATPSLLGKAAAELVAPKPDVILAMGSLSVTALQEATRTVPIVFTLVADPVAPVSSRA